MTAKSGNFLTRMGKLLRAGSALVGNPRLAGAIIHDNAYWKSAFQRKYGHANLLPVVGLDAFVPAKSELPLTVFLGGGSSVTDLLLLRHLAAKEEVNTYFEIGGWRGESLAAVLPFVKKAYTLDLDEKGMDHLGYSKEVRDQMYSVVEMNGKVTQLKGDSARFEFSTIQNKCDLIFIDGTHTYEYVMSDTKNALKHLMHDKSIIVWHDYAFDPEQVRWEVYTAIADAIPVSMHQRLYHVSHTKCALLWPFEPLEKTRVVFPMTSTDRWKVSIEKLKQ